MNLRLGTLLLALAATGCGANDAAERYGEVVVFVDTDLPVPAVVSRVRIDLYSAQGEWFESRDFALPDPQDWPVSFGVHTQQTDSTARTFLRVRAYPEARTRDYRGERFWEFGSATDSPPAPLEAPRLLRDGRDVTPKAEPLPSLTIDRLTLLELTPGKSARLSLLLAGACAGTMARLSATAGAGPAPSEAQSCVDAERVRSVVVAAAANDAAPTASRVGTLRASDCGAPPSADRVCVPGGATILGRSDTAAVPDLKTAPERIVTHGAFFMDRDEVTVARFRAAQGAGFAPSHLPTARTGALGAAPDNAACSFTAAPAQTEGYALTCLDAALAQEFCNYAGGRLPTEAEWEYAATRHTARGRSAYPWGDEAPSCERAVYGRTQLAGAAGVCESVGSGPEPVSAATGDVTPAGIRGLAGGVAEWTLDTAAPYDSACWTQSSMHDAKCVALDGIARVVRGGSWPAPPPVLKSANRTSLGASASASFIGLRCVYPVMP